MMHQLRGAGCCVTYTMAAGCSAADLSGMPGSHGIRGSSPCLPAATARRLPGDVKAPHQRSGLSAQQYSLWLDQHSGEEVVRSVRGSLQGPEVAKARQDPAAAAVLDAMAKLCGQ
jgi:hypothetical protein